jgi:hypothetical protein
MRRPYSGSVPVAGRPGLLRLTDIALFFMLADNVKASEVLITLTGEWIPPLGAACEGD